MTLLRRFPFLPARPLAILTATSVLALAATLACSGLSTDEVVPAVSIGDSPTACGAPASAGVLELSDTGTRVTINHPSTLPRNRVDVFGTGTGIDPTAVIIVMMLPVGTDCPALAQVTVTPAADGTFTATLDLSNYLRMRIVAFAAPAGTVVSCGNLDTCVGVPGYLAMSNALLVELQ